MNEAKIEELGMKPIADELGCGIPPDELAPHQRRAQALAVRKWRTRLGCRS